MAMVLAGLTLIDVNALWRIAAVIIQELVADQMHQNYVRNAMRQEHSPFVTNTLGVVIFNETRTVLSTI